MTYFKKGVHNIMNNKAVEADLDAELKSYVDLLVDQKVKAGMSPDEARRQALIEVGGMERVKDDVRDERPGMMVENAVRDLKHGFRLLGRSPGFAAVAIITIALGIGATSAIFSVVNAVALKPLPYPASGRLTYITSQFLALKFEKFWISPPEFMELRERAKSYESLAAYTTGAWNVSEGASPERVPVVFVSAEMFDVLGVRPQLGQVFTAEQDRPIIGNTVVVIGDALWKRTFGADRSIIGRQVEIQGRKRTVLGVMPPGYDLHDTKAQLWVPLGLDPANRQNRGSHYLFVVGRLKPDVPVERARSELSSILKQWGVINPNTHVPNDSTHRMQMASLRDEVVGNVRNALWVLQGAVLLLLLIACANVANLLLVRAESRNKEFAVRAALGAGRGRILRQFFAEGLVLTFIGAVLGLGIAFFGLRAILAANPDSVPRATEIGLDPSVLLVTTVIALGTATIFAMAPLLHIGEAAVAAVIKEGSSRGTPSAARHRIRRGLVAAEIALAVMLVVGAGLLVRSFSKLTAVDAGFSPDELITFGIAMPGATYTDNDRRLSFINELQRRVQAIPGVDAATITSALPPQREVAANDAAFEGLPTGPGATPQNVDYNQTVTTDYFATMKIPIVKGRGFQPSDAFGAPVVVVNEALVKRFYPNTDPIGKRMHTFSAQDTTWETIVGVARDVKQGGLDQAVGTETYFAAVQQPKRQGFVPNVVNVIVRTSRPLTAIAPEVRRTIREMDAGMPIIQLRTMNEVFGETLTRQRFLSTLLAIFAGVALTLAAIGTYGVVSYLVTERQREIGIRVALGADSGRIVKLVLLQGLSLAGIGIVIGMAAALGLSQVTKKLLFGVSPSDPATYAAVGAVIATIALLACMVPARRAMAVDPLTAIRGD